MHGKFTCFFYTKLEDVYFLVLVEEDTFSLDYLLLIQGIRHKQLTFTKEVLNCIQEKKNYIDMTAKAFSPPPP